MDLVFHLNDSSKAALQALLLPGERVVDARPRSWWIKHRMLLLATVLGTLVFVGLAIALLSGTTTRFLYYTLVTGVFPILLAISLVQGWLSRYKQPFVAVTDQRVIQWDDDKNVLQIPFATILSVSTRVNYLMAMKELEIKVHPEPAAFHATTISRQSPFKVEYVDGLIETDRVLFERLIVDSIPSRVAESSTHSDIL